MGGLIEAACGAFAGLSTDEPNADGRGVSRSDCGVCGDLDGTLAAKHTDHVLLRFCPVQAGRALGSPPLSRPGIIFVYFVHDEFLIFVRDYARAGESARVTVNDLCASAAMIEGLHYERTFPHSAHPLGWGCQRVGVGQRLSESRRLVRRMVGSGDLASAKGTQFRGVYGWVAGVRATLQSDCSNNYMKSGNQISSARHPAFVNHRAGPFANEWDIMDAFNQIVLPSGTHCKGYSSRVTSRRMQLWNSFHDAMMQNQNEF
eukprot:437699-Amphidinium_carterae.1